MSELNFGDGGYGLEKKKDFLYPELSATRKYLPLPSELVKVAGHGATPNLETKHRYSDEACKYRHPDVLTVDGKTLEWFTNSLIITDRSLIGKDYAVNESLLLEEYLRAGIAEASEERPKDALGGELSSHMALYVDKRIGKDSVWRVHSRIMELEPYALMTYPYIALRESEASGLVRQALEDTGVGEQIAAIRAEDAAKPLDLNELMGQ